MVRSDSADEDYVMNGKNSCIEEDDEFQDWNHNNRSASSSTRLGDVTPPNGGSEDKEDRRLRRQIANCNERRRMQSINAGFQSLRSLLPKKDGEKMSKAAILQHTAELIQSLQAEKMRLQEDRDSSQCKKRRMEHADFERGYDMLERERIEELQRKWEHERSLRQSLEDQLRKMNCLSSIPPEGFRNGEHEIIRPTPERPVKTLYPHHHLPVASEVTITTSPILPAHPSTNGSQPAGNSLSNRNLHAILEAIRTLEGAHVFSAPSTAHNNVMVR